MLEFIKKYGDILIGAVAGVGLAVVAKFELETVQLYYSVIILILMCIGGARVIRQAAEKKKERKHSVVDSIVDSTKTIKAFKMAQAPTEEGEKIGEILIQIWRGTMMEKIKTFFSKFKGYMLTIALAVLTVIEMCGGFINSWLGDVLTVNGFEVLPCVTLACAVIVGLLSNGYTKEQQEKIKALFSKSTTNELVLEEIKKTIKEKSAQLTQFNKVLTTQQHELENLNSELETLTNTLNAKKEMFAMVPQLATNEDVQLAQNDVFNCQNRCAAKQAEIANTKATIDNLTTTINALKNQL